ncbi:MAG: thiamine pyrophosphate-dependent dehydrogenase E1 component subunit alpha [Eubacteriaceae bacterium]|nr:thiamine pyrophosphate-dependent dehydrogenase E1 component subunit alpha [Eubacteriaceae bacterium]
MKNIRYFEEAIQTLYKKNEIRGSAHLYIGEEAIAAGICETLDKEDYILSTHRGHGHSIGKGLDPKYMMAELLGKEHGYCKGKGGSMHIGDSKEGILCSNGIVGGGMPISVGAALSVKLHKKDNVIICFFGDGAVCQGNFHESMNMAAVWKLPIIFVCENNQWAISTNTKDTVAAKDVADLAKAYGMKSVIIDGNDILKVYETALEMRDEVIKNQGPVFIEAKTYRLSGHYAGDSEIYRTKEEILEAWKDEPIIRFEEWIANNRPELIEKFKEIEQECRLEIDEAVKFALEDSDPPVSTALEDVFTYGSAWERRDVCERNYGKTGN